MVDKKAKVTFANGRLCLIGDVNANNVMTLYEEGLQAMYASVAIECDCSGLCSSDSSVLALMVEWIKYAQHANKKLYYTHLSPAILTIIQAAGLQSIIPTMVQTTCDA